MFAANCSASSGGWTSGGGNQFTDEHNPWFLGEKPIEYCIDYQEGFPISRSDVKKYIREGFDEWITTLKKYGVHERGIRFKNNIIRY